MAALEAAVEQVKEGLAALYITVLSGQTALNRKVHNILDGTMLTGQQETQLMDSLIHSNLSNVNRSDLVTENLASQLAVVANSGQGALIEVHCASPSLGLANSIQTAVRKHLPKPPAHSQVDVVVNNLDTVDKAANVGPMSYVTPDNDEVAVIAMTCRLPGDINTPEAFWSSLQSRQSTVDEIPKHLFDINNYIGDGVNQTQVRHMHALSEDVTTTMDLRICNISPKEAEQMDPQHRLAILCAYEALEKIGYAPNATQSYDSRRIAYFACATSDDYRENVMGGPMGIGSYFTSGCIRAFIPGMPSFSFKFEGPSNSYDTGENSSLVTLEHAAHALHARQCDVALVGGFSVMTSPHMFIGLDADGTLSHSAEQGLFTADHQGVVRGDAAVVLGLKRLGDAVAEGDKILATLPSISHRTLSNKMSAAEQEAGLIQALSSTGIAPEMVAHVEASGYCDAYAESAEFKAIEKVFGPSAHESRIVTVGTPKPNFGASEAAMSMVQVMKAVLMLQHDYVPPQLPVNNMNKTIRAIHDQGRVVLPFSERNLSDVTSDAIKGRKAIVVHGLAQAGTQAVTFVTSPPAIARSQAPKDTRGAHMVVLSAKSPESLDAMRTALAEYVSDSTDLLRLSYTLAARRNQHPIRIAFAASSASEVKAKLVSTPMVELKGQDKDVKVPTVVLAARLARNMVHDLAQADDTFAAMLWNLNKIGQSFSDRLAQSSLPQVHGDVLMGLYGDMAMMSMLRQWGIDPALVGSGLGTLAALVAADGLSPSEAILAAMLSPTPDLLKAVLLSSGVRPLSFRVRLLMVGGAIQADGRITVATAVDSVMAEVNSKKESAAPVPLDDSSVVLNVRTDPWLDVATFLAELHTSGIDAKFVEVFRYYLPQLRYLHDLPTYQFNLTRHWIEYTDRNLIRDYDLLGTEYGSVTGDSEDLEFDEALTPPEFPMLGRIVKFGFSSGDASIVDGFGMSDVAVYESSLADEPIIRFIKGHLVNDVPLAPATLYADLFMEAAIDVFSRTGVWDADNKLAPELQALEMVRPLTVRGQADDPTTMIIRVKGDFHSDRVFIEISSRAPKVSGGTTDTTHASAHVRLVDPDVWKTTWARFNTLIRSRFRAVRSNENADVIGSKLTYSAFESVVSYTVNSGFRGIRSVALLESTYEAASKVVMSSDVPADIFHANPCYIDSLGQITGFICNSLADPSHVFIADSVGIMRFTKAMSVAAEKGETFEVHCQMAPTDDSKTVFTGDAFFMRASDSAIVGEMVGVRYKQIPTKLLHTLLPPPGVKAKGAGKKGGANPRSPLNSIGASAKAPSATPTVVVGGTAGAASKADEVLGTIRRNIITELGVADSELSDSSDLASMGLDSLMALLITGNLAQELDVEVPSDLFITCNSMNDLRSHFAQQLKDVPGSAPAQVDQAQAQAQMGSVAASPAGGSKTEEVMDRLRRVILTELGIDESELTDSSDLASMGLDSLMALLITGTLQDEMDVEVPGDLFITCNSINDLRAHFAQQLKETAPAQPAPAAPAPVAPEPASTVTTAVAAQAGVSAPAVAPVRAPAPSEPAPAAVSEPSKSSAPVEKATGQAPSAPSVAATSPGLVAPARSPLRAKVVPPQPQQARSAPEPHAAASTAKATNTAASAAPAPTMGTSDSLPRAGETEKHVAEIEGIRLLPPQLLYKSDNPNAPNLFLAPDGSGIGGAYAQLANGKPNYKCNMYGLNSPFVANASAWTGGVRKLALAYLKSIRAIQPKGPYYLGGWSLGGVVAFEIATLLGASSDPEDQVAVLLLLDSPPPCRYPPLPMSMVEWITNSNDVPTPPTLSDRLLAHFQATVDNLAVYGVPPPIVSSFIRRPDRVVHIAARRGVTVTDGEIQPDMTNPTIRWLISPRTGLGNNGWDYHLPDNIIECKEVDANHFTMVHPPASQQLGSLLSLVCAP